MNNGFTLLELLVTLAIISILMCIGLPGIHMLQTQATLDADANLLRSIFFSARQLAVDQHKNITLCFSENHHDCTENKASDLLMFQDKNNNHELNEDQGDELITIQKLHASTLRITTNQPYFIYQTDGTFAGNAGSIKMCLSSQENGQQIIFAMSGRMRTQSVDCSID